MAMALRRSRNFVSIYPRCGSHSEIVAGDRAGIGVGSRVAEFALRSRPTPRGNLLLQRKRGLDTLLTPTAT